MINKKLLTPNKKAIEKTCKVVEEALLEVGKENIGNLSDSIVACKKKYGEKWRDFDYRLIHEKGAKKIRKYTEECMQNVAIDFATQFQLQMIEELKETILVNVEMGLNGKQQIKAVKEVLEGRKESLESHFPKVCGNDTYLN